MAKKAELKRYMKKIMPFVSTVMEKVSTCGTLYPRRREDRLVADGHVSITITAPCGTDVWDYL